MTVKASALTVIVMENAMSFAWQPGGRRHNVGDTHGDRVSDLDGCDDSIASVIAPVIAFMNAIQIGSAAWSGEGSVL